jgi:urease accessory protein UreF
MQEADIRAFARRDWAELDRWKSRFWAERKRTMTAGDALALGDALRRHAQRLRPDWPDAAERTADLTLHARVAEALRAVSVHGAR